ncbi:hypothetical protein [Glaciihabitans sp. dw_435]|uniref:hypothetical protein n=1 Tax=Glaciihabitans sp. dw_435 TaxID=2720081 RepID=UPI001BD35351|nr:hypothetical protein [Glaciihabitans sp. dw_435]
MNEMQTAQLLIVASAIDNRIVSDPAIVAWHQILQDFEYSDLSAALTEHRRSSTEYVTPAHLVAIVKRTRQARAAATPLEASMCATHEHYPKPCDACRQDELDGTPGRKPVMVPLGTIKPIGHVI